VLIKHPKDFWAGVMFITFGIISIVIGSDYPLGTAARMGPGYFPRILGILLIALGAMLSLRALRSHGDAVPRFYFKPLLIVLGSVVIFAIALPTLGLVLSAILVVVLSSLASHEFTWTASIISGVVLSTACVLAFVYGLKLQFQIWPVFFGS
jgi:hypothetical protein